MNNKFRKALANPMHDLLLNCLLGFVFMFIVAFMLTMYTKKNNDGIKPKAEYVITSTWSDKSDCDVDIYVEDPAGNLIFYKRKSAGAMFLDRDDVGRINDTYYEPTSGVRLTNEINQEIVTIRGVMRGEWVINVHLYRVGYMGQEPLPISVTVVVTKLNPTANVVFHRTVELTYYWQEITVVRLKMNRHGNITSKLTDLPKKLVRDNRISPGSQISNNGGVRQPGR